MTRKNRTPEQIIAETQEKLAKMQARAALKSAKANPTLSPIVEAIEALDKDEREARKGLGSGPQSFTTRRKAHTLWLDEIDAQEAHATALLDSVLKSKNGLKAKLAKFAETIANDGEVTEQQVSKACKVTMDKNVAITAADMKRAEEARKAFNVSKRQPKRAKVETATEDAGQASEEEN